MPNRNRSTGFRERFPVADGGYGPSPLVVSWAKARYRDEMGFALPITIFVVTLVTLMLAAVFVRVQVERRIGESSADNVDALATAQIGLFGYMGTVNYDACVRAIRPPDGDSVRINTAKGYSDVVAHVVQKPLDTLDTWMYIVRATGHVIDPAQGADPTAVRTVAQFTTWDRNTVAVVAAYTAANGVSDLGTAAGQLKGVDQAPAGCEDPDVSALRVPTGEGPPSTGSYTLNGTVPYVLESGTGPSVANLTGIDWAAIVAGEIDIDYSTVVLWDATYPVMKVVGDVTLNYADDVGWGTLIVTGNLTLQGSTRLYWYGVILVGGTIEFDGPEQLVDGMVVSGLAEQLGTSTSSVDIDAGIVDIDHDSYHVRQAMRKFAGFSPIANGWVDNWATY